MKREVSPAMAAIALVVVLVVAVFAWMKFTNPAGTSAGAQPPGMPADVAAEFQRRAGGATGPPKGASGPGGIPTMAPSGPPGMAGGSAPISPPTGPPGGG